MDGDDIRRLSFSVDSASFQFFFYEPVPEPAIFGFTKVKQVKTGK